MKRIKGWHFTKGDTLANDDGRKIVVGETLSVEGEIVPCDWGLHLSERAIDALDYAFGNYVWRVEGWGDAREHDGDKWVCRNRKALWGFEAEPVLRCFARAWALDVIHLWKAPKVVVDYLRSGDEELRVTAQNTTWVAAGAAARAAARAADEDAQNTRLERWLNLYHKKGKKALVEIEGEIQRINRRDR